MDTSIQERIRGYQVTPIEKKCSAESTQQQFIQTHADQSDSDITNEGRAPLLAFIGDERQDQPKGIAYSLEDYLELVEWTGRAIIEGKSGAIPADLPPILTRLRVDPAQWVRTVQQFHRRYPRMAGGIDQLKVMAEQLGLRWMHGVGVSRLLYQA